MRALFYEPLCDVHLPGATLECWTFGSNRVYARRLFENKNCEDSMTQFCVLYVVAGRQPGSVPLHRLTPPVVRPISQSSIFRIFGANEAESHEDRK